MSWIGLGVLYNLVYTQPPTNVPFTGRNYYKKHSFSQILIAPVSKDFGAHTKDT